MADPLGIATSQRAETKRDSKTGERMSREDRRIPAEERVMGDRNEALLNQKQILDLTNTPSGSGKVVDDDDVWGRGRIVPRERWVDCPCGNPEEIRGGTLCEVCKILGVPRGIEIARTTRRNVEVENEADLYLEGSNTHEWENKDRRARERGVEASDIDNEGNQSAVAGRNGTDDQANDKGKGKQDVDNVKETMVSDIPFNVFDQAEPSLLRAEELLSKTRTKMQKSWAEDTPRSRPMADCGREIISPQLSRNGMTISRGYDAIDLREAGSALQPNPTMYENFNPPPGPTDTSTPNQHSGTLQTERPTLAERLPKAKSERERVAAGEVVPPRPRSSASFQPFRGVAESREMPVYQRPGRERGGDIEEYERWRAENEKEQLEKDRKRMASLRATSRYASSFRPGRERRRAETGARGRNETSMMPVTAKGEDETEGIDSQPRARLESSSSKISHEQAFKELWRQLCATNGLDFNDDTLKNLLEYRLRKISDRRLRCFMWYDWCPWAEDEAFPREFQKKDYDYNHASRNPTPDDIAEGRVIWDGRVMHSGTTWQDAVQFSKIRRYDQSGPYTLFVPRRKIYGPRCDTCVKRNLSCDEMRPKCGFCTRLEHDRAALMVRIPSSIERMNVERANGRVAKAAEELESYRRSNVDKGSVEEMEVLLVQAHDRAKSRLETLEASLSEREERRKNLDGGRLRSGSEYLKEKRSTAWEYQTAGSDSRSYYRGGECREDDDERVVWYGLPASIDFGLSAWSDREREDLRKDHGVPSSFVLQEKEKEAKLDLDGVHNQKLGREKLRTAKKEAAAAAEEYENYRSTIWAQGGLDRNEIDLRQKVEMAEALLERLEKEERRSMPEKEVRHANQLGGKVHHRGNPPSREVPLYDRDSETRSEESREATLHREYEANQQRGSTPSREPEIRHRFEEEKARRHRAFRLEELAKMKEFKQQQQEQGYSIDTTSAEKPTSEGIFTDGHTLTGEVEDELEARLEGLVLRTKVQVPEAMRRAMEEDGEWRSFA